MKNTAKISNIHTQKLDTWLLIKNVVTCNIFDFCFTEERSQSGHFEQGPAMLNFLFLSHRGSVPDQSSVGRSANKHTLPLQIFCTLHLFFVFICTNSISKVIVSIFVIDRCCKTEAAIFSVLRSSLTSMAASRH